MADLAQGTRGSDSWSAQNAAQVDMKIEVSVVLVSDVDPAKEFYQRPDGGWTKRRPAFSSSRPKQASTPARMTRRRHESGLLDCYISIHFG
jgi:hypothetical protein